MVNNIITIETHDCCPFDSKWNQELFHFAEESRSVSVFNISEKHKPEEQAISYNYLDKQWYAGRYVGNIHFTYNKSNYNISIKPRFGDIVLLKMFEQLFNIKFSSGISSFNTDNKSYYLKLMISFIWLQKLANANRHGLPRIKRINNHEDYTVKGKLLIRPSITSLHKTGKIVTARREQLFDQVVITILYQAYCILKSDYQLGLLKIPFNALDAIHNIENQTPDNRFVNQYEYKSIKYHPMYQCYKDIVDFSWQIIQSRTGYDSKNSAAEVSGFFLDMAEIWECYIRSILKNYLSSSGWQITESQYELYSNRFYGRKIIPDIVLKRGNSYCVFDAKYKNMQFRPGFAGDVDRNDFFQIHTYISFLQTKGNVILGGLLYPLTNSNSLNNISSSQLYGDELLTTHFTVDGPEVQSQSIETDSFFSRIDLLLDPIIVDNNAFA